MHAINGISLDPSVTSQGLRTDKWRNLHLPVHVFSIFTAYNDTHKFLEAIRPVLTMSG